MVSTDYDKLMGDYMAKVGMDLTQDQSPPKDLFVEVNTKRHVIVRRPESWETPTPRKRKFSWKSKCSSFPLQVRVMKDYGEIQTDTGAVKLDKNTVHFLRRSDCEVGRRFALTL